VRCQSVNTITGKILAITQQSTKICPHCLESATHVNFARNLAQEFVGRSDIVSKILDSVTRQQESVPIVVVGPAGSGKFCRQSNFHIPTMALAVDLLFGTGKSAMLSRVLNECAHARGAWRSNGVFIFRSIGLTAASSSVGVCNEYSNFCAQIYFLTSFDLNICRDVVILHKP
jgi:hypothetical protein